MAYNHAIDSDAGKRALPGARHRGRWAALGYLMRVEILGVHPVIEADEPCHLVEIQVSDLEGEFDIGKFHQPRKDGNRSASVSLSRARR